MELSGTLLTGREMDPVEGRVVVEDGVVTAIEETRRPGTDIVFPAFVNAHTHIGDSVAKEAGEGLSLEELVAPPDGLKHRILRSTDREELVAAMTRSLRFMTETGTTACIEFREGGVEGVRAIEDATEGTPVDPVVLGRETVAAMRESDGFGASGANDADFTEERAATMEARKIFAIHAGEVDASDLTPAMNLDPDFLVHVVHPESGHLERLAEERTPVVVCPRSNLTTKVGVPPIDALAERTTLALGTDNVMTNSPSMFREMEFAAKLSNLPAAAVLRMATVNGAELAGLDCGVLAEGRPAKLVVLDGDSDNLAGVRDPVRAVVRRAGASDVKRVVH